MIQYKKKKKERKASKSGQSDRMLLISALLGPAISSDGGKQK